MEMIKNVQELIFVMTGYEPDLLSMQEKQVTLRLCDPFPGHAEFLFGGVLYFVLGSIYPIN
jgi:hypothetical protein